MITLINLFHFLFNKPFLFLFYWIFYYCNVSKKQVDLLIFNATVYTVDSSFSKAEAIAIKEGKIIAVGDTNDLLNKYNPKQKIDAGSNFIYPGFIDAHAHFLSYGNKLKIVDLVGTTSWEDVLNKLKIFADQHKDGWLLGRGWDQNDWKEKKFPDKQKLDELFPARLVLLSRIDGHAAIANQKALDLAGVKAGDKLTGGEIEVINGKLTGILIDNAVGLVSSRVPAPDENDIRKALLAAQKNCFAVGLTTIDECGLNYQVVELIDKLQKANVLKMRLYVMLSDANRNLNFLFKKGPVKTDKLNVRSFKIYADGAIGSRGACLLQPYSDKPAWYGFLLSNQQHFDSVAELIYNKGFQLCTHAIGDSGNRTILKIYAKYLKGKNDLRWRIEHAQVLNENDFSIFGKYSIIPSVQPTHATSDMYWAGERLGKEREKGAYAYRQLLNENGWIALGTDFPVEDISPFKTFYASVVRQDERGWPPNGYQPENALSREQTLRGMTIWAAKANFEENEKGSLEKGKFADFVILDKDLMTVKVAEILKIKVLKTFLGGEMVYDGLNVQ